MKRHILVMSLSALCAATCPALAQNAAPTNMAAAEALFQESRVLMGQGRFKEACPKLAESQRLDPAVGTLLYLAECYEKNGQTASAWATFELAAAEGRKARQAERELAAKERAQQLVPRLSRLSIGVADNATIAGLVITNDGVEIGKASWGTPLPVDPGKHTVQATAPGKKPWSLEVNVTADSATTQVSVPLLEDLPPPNLESAQPATPAPLQAAPAVTTESKPESYWGTQRIVGVSLAGAGVVGMGLGTVLAALAQGKEADSEKYCAPNDPTRCTQRGVDMIDSAKSQNTLGNVFIGVGGALLVGGAVVFFTSPKASEQPQRAAKAHHLSVVPALSQNAGAFLVSGQF